MGGGKIMRKRSARLAATILLALALGSGALAQEGEHAASETPHYPIEHPGHVAWSFSGPFGKYDPQQLQRGFQVYREVCSSCHSLDFVAFRNLADPGGPHFTEEEVAALAAEYQITDGPDDMGDMFERPGRPSDYFPAPFANEQAARASNGGAYPPDLSLIAKARAGGPDYLVALLTGYRDPPAGFDLLEGMNYNEYFQGHQIAMPPPLAEGSITTNGNNAYEDGTPATVPQMAADVAAFLMWAAEPHLETRKQTGVKVILFLLVMTGLLYAAKRKVWSDQH